MVTKLHHVILPQMVTLVLFIPHPQQIRHILIPENMNLFIYFLSSIWQVVVIFKDEFVLFLWVLPIVYAEVVWLTLDRVMSEKTECSEGERHSAENPSVELWGRKGVYGEFGEMGLVKGMLLTLLANVLSLVHIHFLPFLIRPYVQLQLTYTNFDLLVRIQPTIFSPKNNKLMYSILLSLQLLHSKICIC